MTVVTLSLKPATVDRETALEYTGLSEAEFKRHEEKGVIQFKPIGKNGRRLVPTAQLDSLVASIWAQDNGQPDEDMDCGDD